MDKELKLKRLWDTIQMIADLEKKQFNYQDYVSESKLDKKSYHRCPTVCCVAGWYPSYFKEAGLVWSMDGHLYANTAYGTIEERLKKYHGLRPGMIRSLFMGMPCYLLLSKEGIAVEKLILKASPDWKKYNTAELVPGKIKINDVPANRMTTVTKNEIQARFELVYYLLENNYILV